jgi:hypothetical protein
MRIHVTDGTHGETGMELVPLYLDMASRDCLEHLALSLHKIQGDAPGCATRRCDRSQNQAKSRHFRASTFIRNVLLMTLRSSRCWRIIVFAILVLHCLSFAGRRNRMKRCCDSANTSSVAQCQTGRRRFVFRESGWCSLLPCHIAERNSWPLAPNIREASYFKGMRMR